MELSPSQIDQLFAFTKKKFVHWYDLQCELVDHLASRIEEELDANPSLDFDRALKKVYDGFGIFGFANIVKEKTEQLQQRSRRIWWQAFRSFFGWPHIVLVLGVTALVWQLSQVISGWILLLFLAPYVWSEVKLFRQRRRQRRTEKRLLLLEVSPLQYSNTMFFFSLLVNLDDHAGSIAIFLLGIISLLSMLINLASIKAYREVTASAEAQFPEAFAPAS